MKTNPTIRVTWIGAVVNVALAAVKMTVGATVGSIALVADGVHSFSDLLTDAAVVIGVKAGERPADDCHPYGHGKYETFATAAIATTLIVVGLGIVWESGKSFFDHEPLTSAWAVMAAAALSVLLKEWLFRVTRRVALRMRSAAALANAWHHRSDALSSVAVLAGGAIDLSGWHHGDALAGVVVGAMVIQAGRRILTEALMELTDASVEQRYKVHLEKTLREMPEVRGWHACRGRHVGREVFLDCHILVDADMSVSESHRVTGRVKKRLRRALQRPVNLLLHVEPYYGDKPSAASSPAKDASSEGAADQTDSSVTSK